MKKVYLFVHSENTHFRPATAVSVHKTNAGAGEAIEDFKRKKFEEWLEQPFSERDKKPVGEFEFFDIVEMELYE